MPHKFNDAASRRGASLQAGIRKRPPADEPVHLVVDSTGLKIFGAGEWLEEKHKTDRKRRTWRKLHLGLDLLSGEILCADLTLESIGDTTALPDLLDQVDPPVTRFVADGAYDGGLVSDLVEARLGAEVEIIIPPPKNAVASADAARNPTSRDRHIDAIATQGRMGWQKSGGYNQRARIEARMARWKTVIGPNLKARALAGLIFISALHLGSHDQSSTHRPSTRLNSPTLFVTSTRPRALAWPAIRTS